MSRPVRKVRPAPKRTEFPLVVLSVTALTPFLVHIRPVYPFSARFAGIALSASLWLWVWARAPSALRIERRLVVAAAAVAVAAVLAAAFSADPGAAFTFGAEHVHMGAPSWLGLLVVLVLVSGLTLDPGSLNALSIAFVWGVSSLAVGAFRSVTTLDSPGAGFGNGNYWGTVMLCLAPLALAISLTVKGWRRQVWRWGCAAFFVGAMLSKSATVFAVGVSMLAGVALLAPRLLHPALERHRRAAAALVAAGVLFIAVAFALYLAPTAPAAVKHVIDRHVLGPTGESRVEMWKAGLAVFAQRPLFGAGPDGLPLASQGFVSPALMRVEAREVGGFHSLIPDPHSLPVLVLGSLGAVGAAALGWLLFEWAALLWRRVREDEGMRSVRILLALSVVSFLGCMLLIPWSIAFGPLPVLLAGMAIAPSTRTAPAPAAKPPTGVRLGVAVVVTVGALGLSVASLAGNWYSTHADLAAGDSLESLKVFAKAERLQPTRTYLRYEMLYLQGKLLGEGMGTIEGYRRDVDGAPRLVRSYGGYLANLVQAALDEAYLRGRRDLGWERERLAEASRLAPNHPEVVLEGLHLAVLEGDTERAAERMAVVRRICKPNVRYPLYEVYFHRLIGDKARERAFSARVIEETPGFTSLLTSAVPR